MIYRLVFGIGGLNEGWYETHAIKRAETDPALLLPLLSQLAQKRANFLGAPFSVLGVRLSKFSDDGATTRQKGSVLLKQPFTTATPSVTGSAEPGNVALIVRGTANVTNPDLAAFAGRQNTTWCGAPPDDAVSLGGQVDLGKAGLGAANASFWELMIGSGAGWLAAARTDDVKIAAATQNTDGTVEFLLQRAPAPAPALFVPQNVRVRAVNNGQSPLNGSVLGYFNTNTTFQTQDVIGIARAQVGGMMRVYKVIPTFLPYAGYLTQLITGEHKRGRPPFSPRGRQPRRVRG